MGFLQKLFGNSGDNSKLNKVIKEDILKDATILAFHDGDNGSSSPEAVKDSPYVRKNNAKHEAKKRIKTKFVIGEHYILHTKARDNSKPIIREFVCKKFIYTMKDIPMNVVIMKQVDGPERNKYTIDKARCKDFHIKWEPGLEIFAMEMNWIRKKKVKNSFQIS